MKDNLLNVQWSIPGLMPSAEEIQHFYDMQQGSPEWLAKRNRFLTSTVVLVIICVSSFNGPVAYWRWIMREYSNIKPEPESLKIMGHGTFHEDPVRKEYNKIAGTTFHEVGTIVYKQMPGLACNVDGLMFNKDGKLIRLCEIKCPVFAPYKDVVGYGRPPISHFAQCQINMNIVECEEIYYIMCHIPNEEMKKGSIKNYELSKRRYYHRYLCQESRVSPDDTSATHTTHRKKVEAMSIDQIPKIGLLYCIAVKRSRVFWNYITAHVRRFWNQNVTKFQPPIEDASTGKRDYDWFIREGILDKQELEALFTPIHIELAVNMEEYKRDNDL